MSKADELKAKNGNLFERNTILLNENERLKKENAELQGSLELYESGCCRAEKECAIKEQLAQAKEIIKGLLSCCRNYPQENAEKVKQAEQFLNSEVDK